MWRVVQLFIIYEDTVATCSASRAGLLSRAKPIQARLSGDSAQMPTYRLLHGIEEMCYERHGDPAWRLYFFEDSSRLRSTYIDLDARYNYMETTMWEVTISRRYYGFTCQTTKTVPSLEVG